MPWYHVEVRGQLVGSILSFHALHGFQGLNLGHQAWTGQVPLPAEPLQTLPTLFTETVSSMNVELEASCRDLAISVHQQGRSHTHTHTEECLAF